MQTAGDYTLDSGDSNSAVLDDGSAATDTADQAYASETDEGSNFEGAYPTESGVLGVGSDLSSETIDDSTDATITSSDADSDSSAVGRKFGRHSRHNQKTTVAKRAYEITTVVKSTSAVQDADDLVKRAETESEGSGNTVNAVIGLVVASWFLALL
ncbi:unnamed protein product [Ambrosiozyma monospora]|uniref:Unnamed protein product n=1 Tax=Ambrosiozyma monospora TaxID=43982 RepID=A0ACB5SZE5_AMBMO|nr:unnamed protein product [Ambrosiozyma monospora]